MQSATGLQTSPFDYIVQDILPAREIHLIGGPSGSGKTTWIFQVLIPSIQIGAPVLARDSHPTGICYIACDRSEASLQRTLKRLKIPLTIPSFSITKRKEIRTLLAVITEARKRFPETHLLIVDAMAMLVPEGRINDYKTVADFLTDASNLCDFHNITIIGLLHSPKTKEGEDYANPRQRIAGTVAWGGFADTVILMEPCKENSAERMLTLCARNAEEEEFFYRFSKEGTLESISGPNDSTTEALDQELLPRLKNDHEYRRSEIMELVGQVGLKCSLSSLKRWLKAKVTDGVLFQQQKGTYRIFRQDE